MTLPCRTVPRLALAALSLAACAQRQRFEDANAPEGLVEVLPRSAVVEVDGVVLGPGSRTLPVHDRGATHRLSARAPGFEPIEVRVPASLLAGGRVGLVLRPAGFGVARPLELDEPSGLASAAALLLRHGRADEAAQYAARAAEVAPNAPAPRRILGDAWLAAGRRDLAVREYATWLTLAPADDPARPEVERRVSELRGDIDVPARPR
jgi:tetratricopeptide (TPR) repeat protein